MLGVQRVSPNEGKNPRPRLLKIAFCSSRNKILTDISPSLDARLEGQRAAPPGASVVLQCRTAGCRAACRTEGPESSA